MLFADGALGVVLLGLWLFCIIDVITTDESQIRNMPKTAWLMIVIFLFDIGSIAWLVAGRNWHGAGGSRPASRSARRYPEYDRPGRHVATNPDDDDDFLRGVRERAEAQRREYRDRRKRELAEENERLTRRPDDEPT